MQTGQPDSLKTDGSGKLAFTSSLPGVTATTAELNYLDITTLGLTEASKALQQMPMVLLVWTTARLKRLQALPLAPTPQQSTCVMVNLFEHDLTENVTYTFSNSRIGQGIIFVLKRYSGQHG